MATEIRAVHRKDLNQVLESMGLGQALANGELKCFNCGRTVDAGDIGTVFKRDGELRVCCSRMDCLAKVLTASPSKDA